jgi:AcrR family transcriptional regulator
MVRRRSSRALSNDAAIRLATVKLINDVGIDAISFRDVGRVAKLSHGALYARFEDVEELLVDLWSEVLEARARFLLRDVIRLVKEPTAKSVGTFVRDWRQPSPVDVAMVHVLLTSRRFVIVREEVERFINDDLETCPSELSQPQHSRVLTLFAFALFGIIASSQDLLAIADVGGLQALLLESLKVAPHEIIARQSGDEREFASPHVASDLSARLAFHTFVTVGSSGYARATISRITRRTDCSPAAIYKVFPSKEELVIHAVRTIMEAPWITLSSLADILEPGHLSHILYATASDVSSARKLFTLEVAIASVHAANIRSAVQLRLRDLEAAVTVLDDVDVATRARLIDVVRIVTYLTLGVGFLSTMTRATDRTDFTQIAEPLRLAMLEHLVPNWSDVRGRLKSLAGATPSYAGD